MYLITVARAAEEGASGPVSVAALAEALEVSVTSANEMVRKLAAKDLVEYLPYKGARLTEIGERIAGRVLRKRRLWATFLAEHLEFSPAEADELACPLEHVTPSEAAERLAAYLGDPAAGPLGRPIPAGDAGPHQRTTISIDRVPAGREVEIVSCSAPAEIAGYLASNGIVPGARLTVAATAASGVLLDIDRRWVNLSTEIAHLIETAEGASDARP